MLSFLEGVDLGLGFACMSHPQRPKSMICRNGLPNAIYNFETWGQQAADYISQRVQEPAVIICNSVGGLAGLQAAQEDTSLIKAVQV